MKYTKELTNPRQATFFTYHLERKYFVPNKTMINQLLFEADKTDISFNFFEKWNQEKAKYSKARLTNQGFLMFDCVGYKPYLLGSILEELSTFAFLSKQYPVELK